MLREASYYGRMMLGLYRLLRTHPVADAETLIRSQRNISEVGPIGYSCRQMRTGNCVHLLDDSVAAITRPRRAPFSEVEVSSLLFTALLPFAPHVLINAEMDDYGILERAHCDGVFSRVGFGAEIRDLFSFGKLTGQGMTLLGTDLVRILEEVLPARLGASRRLSTGGTRGTVSDPAQPAGQPARRALIR